MSIKAIIADDHAVLRRGVRKTLEEASVQVVGEASNGDEAVQLVESLEPDVIVLDIQMPRSGIEVARVLSERFPSVKVVALSAHSEYALDFLAEGVAGGRAYVLKDDDPQMIVSAVCAVAQGQPTWLSPRIQSIIAEYATSNVHVSSIDELTSREIDVLTLLSQGLLDKQIAEQLEISSRTVRFHVENIVSKLRVSSRIEAVAEAVRRKIVD